ncbi:hypothetical protein TanjilG_11058 [Lupinus angustifolius]|uniref:FRIGIDA-like protein n=2 Tax=Lupinus angustifolius TaxID=3871 RepID=A0A1J7H9Y0_LUPAN|nr:hypothetical protein TanjilG_11058 [Lupinus angustifolius]
MGDSEQSMENNTEALMEQLSQAFLELEARKVNFENKIQWVEIKQHFLDLEVTLKKQLEEVEAKVKVYEEKQIEMDTIVAERKVAVDSKEQDLLDRLQELKDAAVASIAEARAIHQTASLEFVYDGENKNNEVSNSLGNTDSEEDFPHKPSENSEGVAVEFRPLSVLTNYCEQMNVSGLLNYIEENKKNLSVIREVISVALESATDPAQLVLDSLKGFYPANPKDKRDAALHGRQKSCIIILEALATLSARADPGADYFLKPETKQQAKAIADEWRPELARADIDSANGNSLEAEAFLQVLSTFRIASEFDEEELRKLVLAVSQRKRAPELCRSVGLIHKVPAIVESLISNEKQISAVHFIHAFKLEDSFASVPLLKEYLKNQRRNLQVKAGGVSDVLSAKNDANVRELRAVKAVIKCIEEYNLQSDYPLDTLQKRVSQLQRTNPDKKRSGEFNKRHQSKRPRANERYSSSRSFGGATASAGVVGRHVPPVRTTYTGTPDRYSHAGAIAYDYQVPGQTIHTQPANVPPSNYDHHTPYNPYML